MKKFLPLFAICMLLAMNVYSKIQVVTLSGHAFSPKSFTISLGDTIRWTWVSGSHTTTSTSVPAGAATWNKNINSGSKTFDYIPSKTGPYNYKCTPHASAGMVGDFTVTSGCPAASAQISAAGPTTFCKNGSVLLNSTVSANITAYQWKKGGVNIAGATSPTYSATATGSYTLMVTNNCGNSATSNAISVTVNPLPPATITPSGTVNICSGDSITLLANTGTGLTYQWTKNGANIAGATKNNYKAKTAGNYRVVVTRTSTGCKRTSAVTKVTVSTCLASVKIFPNPSSGNFNIALPSYNNEAYSLSIFDNNGNLLGKKDLRSKELTFGNELKPGIYLVQIKNGSAIVYEEKIVKE